MVNVGKDASPMDPMGLNFALQKQPTRIHAFISVDYGDLLANFH